MDKLNEFKAKRLLLSLQSFVCDKERISCLANSDLQIHGKYMCDYDGIIKELQTEITLLEKEIDRLLK